MESNQDPDFAEDEGVYDELNLEEAEVYGFANDDEDGSEQATSEGALSLNKAHPIAPQTPPKKDVRAFIDTHYFQPEVSPVEARKDDLLRRKPTKEKEAEEVRLWARKGP